MIKQDESKRKGKQVKDNKLTIVCDEIEVSKLESKVLICYSIRENGKQMSYCIVKIALQPTTMGEISEKIIKNLIVKLEETQRKQRDNVYGALSLEG